MAHDHHHGHAGHTHNHAGHLLGDGSPSAGLRHRHRLAWAFAVQAVFMVAEVVAALATNSLALLSDAGHMFTDVLGLGMALAAVQLAATRRAGQRTFGLYRVEILAALANAVLLLAVTVWVVIVAIGRIGDAPEILSGPMLVVAVAGLGANLVAFALLRPGAGESLNVRGAYLEMVADAVGSVGVIAAGATIALTGWTWIDPVVGIAIGGYVLPRTWRLAAEAVRILVEAAPPGTDLEAMASELAALDGVVDVHDLHVWTLTSDMEVASAHLMVAAGTDHHGVLDGARDLLRDRYGIGHATLPVEPDDHEGCSDVSW
jgi:cobalt-zinc-cadmium efflux system protein